MEHEVSILTSSAASLDLAERTHRWGHLSLCVLDATFSINARYNAAVAPTVRRYADWANLSDVLVGASHSPLSPRDGEQTLSEFLASIDGMDDESFAADVLRNRQVTSTRGGIRKAAAVRQLAGALRDHGVEILADVPVLMADLDRLATVEGQLNSVKGSGLTGVRTGYIWMTAGDDHTVKPDRHILKWIQKAIGRRTSVTEARTLLKETAHRLQVTPWVLDAAAWKHMSRRSAKTEG